MSLFRTGSENLTENLTASLAENLAVSLTENLTANLTAPRGRRQRPPARKLLNAWPFCAHRYSSAAGPPAGLRLVRRAPRAPVPWMTDSGASGTRPGRPSVSGAPTARPAMVTQDAPRAPVEVRAVVAPGDPARALTGRPAARAPAPPDVLTKLPSRRPAAMACDDPAADPLRRAAGPAPPLPLPHRPVRTPGRYRGPSRVAPAASWRRSVRIPFIRPCLRPHRPVPARPPPRPGPPLGCRG